MVGPGGEVRLSSGLSSSGSSGRTFLESAPSGPNGSSGDIGVYTGTSEAGTSGAIYIQTGSSTNAAGGLISLTSGNGGGLVDGGDITLTAGQTVSHAVLVVPISPSIMSVSSNTHYPTSLSTQQSAQGRKGGSVHIAGGEGSSAHTTDGGDGGDIVMTGGEAKGESANDNGGSVTIQGGTSYAGYGG